MIKRIYNRIWRYISKKSRTVTILYTVNELKKRGLLEIGEHTYGTPIINRYNGSDAKVTIGKFCSIAPNVRIITGGIHPTDRIALYPYRIKWQLPGALEDGMPKTNGPINIGHDVWLCTGATILSGVTIGHGSVISANALVSKDVPPYSIVVGNPGKIVRRRFSEDEIVRLLELKWWDWPKNKIITNIDILNGTSVDALFEHLNEKNQNKED